MYSLSRAGKNVQKTMSYIMSDTNINAVRIVLSCFHGPTLAEQQVGTTECPLTRTKTLVSLFVLGLEQSIWAGTVLILNRIAPAGNP